MANATKKVINVLFEYEGIVYRFGELKLKESGDIYFNHQSQLGHKLGDHDSYHASYEVHMGRSADYEGSVFQFKAPELITSPVGFSSSVARFEWYRQYNRTPSRNDVLIYYTSKATHPIIGVYLEPQRSYMVHRTYKATTPPGVQIVAVRTKRFTPALDVAIVAVSTQASSGGLLGFDPRHTSRGYTKYLQSITGWQEVPAANIKVSTGVVPKKEPK